MIFPPQIVVRTLASRIFSGAMLKMFRSRTTRSASFPVSIVPLSRSANSANAPPAVKARTASSTVIFWAGTHPPGCFPSKVARVTVNFAGNRDEAVGDIYMSWFHPPNYLGPFLDQDPTPFQRLAEMLSSVGLETTAVSQQEIRRQVFYKTILNAALNALCATAGLTMAEAMMMRHTRDLARHLIREALTVAAHMGYHYGEDALNKCMEYLDKGGAHYPSMWADLQNKRRTEIDFINGKIVELAMMFTHLDVSLNRFFCTMVMTEEIRAGVRTVEEIPSYLACEPRLSC